VGYSEDLAIEKRPKMRCDWASKSPSYFLPVPKDREDNPALASQFQEWLCSPVKRSMQLLLAVLNKSLSSTSIHFLLARDSNESLSC